MCSEIAASALTSSCSSLCALLAESRAVFPGSRARWQVYADAALEYHRAPHPPMPLFEARIRSVYGVLQGRERAGACNLVKVHCPAEMASCATASSSWIFPPFHRCCRQSRRRSRCSTRWQRSGSCTSTPSGATLAGVLRLLQRALVALLSWLVMCMRFSRSPLLWMGSRLAANSFMSTLSHLCN